MTRAMTFVFAMGLFAALSQASCDSAERIASASEAEVSRETCALGAMESVARCGGVAASCHVCGRPEGDEAVCLQPCTLGKDECPGSQRCLPIGALRDGGGYARVGDCPAGYCQ